MAHAAPAELADHIDPVDPTPPRFISLLRECLVPQGWVDRALLLIVALWPVSMWLNGYVEMPNAPLAARLMYTFGDSQYFDAMRSIAFAGFGEWGLLEHRGEGFLAFPIYPFLIPAMLLRLFGLYGLLASVAVTLWLALISCRLLLRAIGVSPLLATLGAGVMVVVPWANFVTFHETQLLNLWQPRVGRPMGTAPPMLLSLALLAHLAHQPARWTQRGLWVALTASVLLTLQGDLHTGITLGFIEAIAWIATFVGILHQNEDRRRLVARFAGTTLLAGAAGLIVLVPFVIARLREDPDLPAHLGLMTLSRTRPFLDRGAIVPYLAVGLCYAAGVYGACRWHARRYLPSNDLGSPAVPLALRLDPAAHPIRVVRHVPWVLLLAYFALPLSVILLGRGAQLFHFRDTIRYLMTIVYFAGGCVVLQLVLDVRGRASLAVRRPAVVAMIGLVPPLLAIVVPVVARDLPERFRDYEGTSAGYRATYVELADHLLSERYRDAVVLATFDSNIYPYWSGILGRAAYMSEILTTTMPDAVTEQRYIEVCRLLGLDDEQFVAHLIGPANTKHPETLSYRVGQGKYVATRWYSRDPLEAYTPADQAKIRAASPDFAWNLVVSLPERARLLRRFQSASRSPRDLSGRLDVIVLRASDAALGMRPPSDAFELTLRNANYEVWGRKRSTGTP